MSTINRRNFLGLAGMLGGAAAGTMFEPSRAFASSLSSSSSGTAKAIVIGSGFGGSVAALRLGCAGVQTLVLERGKSWKYSPTAAVFGNEVEPNDSMFWFQNVATWPGTDPVPLTPGPGVMEVALEDGVAISVGSMVGGGSALYSGCTVQPARRHFEMVFPAGVSYSEMDAVYYPRVRSMIGSSTVPADLYNSDVFTHSRVFDKQMRAAGYTPTPSESVFNWGKLRKELSGQFRPSATVGESSFGNSDGAKNDMTQTYLPAAVKTGNVAISALTEVTAIHPRSGGGFLVDVLIRNDDGSTATTRQLSCEMLFLAAGSVNTNRLLVAARDSGAMPNLSSTIGTNWGTNGDAFGVRSYDGDLGPSQAAPCASATFVEKGFELPVRIENWFAMVLNGTQGMLQFSVALDLDNRGSWAYDPATKKVSLSDWSLAKNAPAEKAAADFNQMIIDRGLAGEYTDLPAPTALTAHPLGGVQLGNGADLYGRINGYRGLYAVDASIIPGNCAGANPSLTIAALAERSMSNIIANGG